MNVEHSSFIFRICEKGILSETFCAGFPRLLENPEFSLIIFKFTITQVLLNILFLEVDTEYLMSNSYNFQHCLKLYE